MVSCLFIYFWFIYSCECVWAPEPASLVSLLSLLSPLLLFEAAAKTSFSSQQVLKMYITFFHLVHIFYLLFMHILVITTPSNGNMCLHKWWSKPFVSVCSPPRTFLAEHTVADTG